MIYDPEKHHRRSIRLKGYDYAQEGWYFITLVVQDRACLFGEIFGSDVKLNRFGKIIDFHWKKLEHHFKHIELDRYVIMPNHFHGIVHIVRAMHLVDDKSGINSKLGINASPKHPRPVGTKPGSVSAIIQNFKSTTSRKINRIKKTHGVRLWQRNYWEHVVRDEDSLNRIRNYIVQNPGKWTDDKIYKP